MSWLIMIYSDHVWRMVEYSNKQFYNYLQRCLIHWYTYMVTESFVLWHVAQCCKGTWLDGALSPSINTQTHSLLTCTVSLTDCIANTLYCTCN